MNNLEFKTYQLIIKEQTEKENNDFLTVHLVIHSHNDIGWVYTPDEYYNKTTNNVEKIYDSAFDALLNNKERIFNIMEIYFFEKWYQSKS